MHSTGSITVNLNHNGKSIPHNCHPLELCSVSLLSPRCFFFFLFGFSYTNKWSFKFQRWRLSWQSQKQLHSFLGTLMIFKSTHTGADNKIIDTAHSAKLVSHVMEISDESICSCPINSPTRRVARVVMFWYYSLDEKEINWTQFLVDLVTSNPECGLQTVKIQRDWVDRLNIFHRRTDR